MKKFNEICEKYISALWCFVASLWFFVEYAFGNPRVDNMLYSGLCWIVFAVVELIRISRKKSK